MEIEEIMFLSIMMDYYTSAQHATLQKIILLANLISMVKLSGERMLLTLGKTLNSTKLSVNNAESHLYVEVVADRKVWRQNT